MSTNADKQFGNTNPGRTYWLRLNPAAGSSYEYETKNESDIVMKVNGEETHVINRVTVGTEYTIDKDSTGNFLIGISYKKILLYTRNADGEGELNAANGSFSANPVEKMLGILKNAHIIATVSPVGEVKQMNGYQEFTDTVLSKFALTNAADRRVAEKQWNQMVGDGIIRKNIGQLFQLFPDSAIHAGDKWKINLSQNGDIKLITKAIYSLSDINNGNAIIRIVGKISSDSTGSTIMNYPVSTQLQGEQEGVYEVDMKSGMVLKGKVSAKVEGSIMVIGREVPVTIKTTIDVAGYQKK